MFNEKKPSFLSKRRNRITFLASLGIGLSIILFIGLYMSTKFYTSPGHEAEQHAWGFLVMAMVFIVLSCFAVSLPFQARNTLSKARKLKEMHPRSSTALRLSCGLLLIGFIGMLFFISSLVLIIYSYLFSNLFTMEEGQKMSDLILELLYIGLIIAISSSVCRIPLIFYAMEPEERKRKENGD